MSRRVRTGLLIGILGLGFVLVAFLSLGRMFRSGLASAPQPTPLAEMKERVAIVTHNIPLGTMLRSEDLKISDVPVGLVPEGGLTNIEAAVGKFTRVDLVAGEMVLKHNLADPTNVSHDAAFIIESNQVMLAFPAADLMSTLNVIQRGDTVDIFATVEEEVPTNQVGLVDLSSGKPEETEKRIFTFNALERVQITAMVVDIVEDKQSSPSPVDSASLQAQQNQKASVRAYLLALPPQDALMLKHLKDIGASFDLVLRAPTASQLLNTDPITRDYFLDRYKLRNRR